MKGALQALSCHALCAERISAAGILMRRAFLLDLIGMCSMLYIDVLLWNGAGSYFVLSMLDRLWRPDLTEEEAVQLMEKGIEEVSHKHHLISYAHHSILPEALQLSCPVFLGCSTYISVRTVSTA